jgi:hypothetical protein
VEGAAAGRFSSGFCDWNHDLIDPAVVGVVERIDGSGLMRPLPSLAIHRGTA